MVDTVPPVGSRLGKRLPRIIRDGEWSDWAQHGPRRGRCGLLKKSRCIDEVFTAGRTQL